MDAYFAVASERDQREYAERPVSEDASTPGCLSVAAARAPAEQPEEAEAMASSDRGAIGGISLGGILVIAGIVVAIIWSFWAGLIMP